MRTWLLPPALAMILTLAAPLCRADVKAPDAMLNAVTMEVIASLRQSGANATNDPAAAVDLIEKRIAPHFDFERMAQTAIALNWRLASTGQKVVLTREFRTLLVRTYSVALSGYSGQSIEFLPLRAAPGETDVTVRSLVRKSGRAPIAMNYDLQLAGADWKVYDITIEGISLVTTYRTTFASTVRNSGVDGLIRLLTDKNRQSDERFRPRRTGDFFLPAIYLSLRYAR